MWSVATALLRLACYALACAPPTQSRFGLERSAVNLFSALILLVYDINLNLGLVFSIHFVQYVFEYSQLARLRPV